MALREASGGLGVVHPKFLPKKGSWYTALPGGQRGALVAFDPSDGGSGGVALEVAFRVLRAQVRPARHPGRPYESTFQGSCIMWFTRVVLTCGALRSWRTPTECASALGPGQPVSESLALQSSFFSPPPCTSRCDFVPCLFLLLSLRSLRVTVVVCCRFLVWPCNYPTLSGQDPDALLDKAAACLACCDRLRRMKRNATDAAGALSGTTWTVWTVWAVWRGSWWGEGGILLLYYRLVLLPSN